MKYVRYGAGWAIWLLLLAASASLQYALTRLAEEERNERITRSRFEATLVRAWCFHYRSTQVRTCGAAASGVAVRVGAGGPRPR